MGHHLQASSLQGHWQMQIIRSWKERKRQGTSSFLIGRRTSCNCMMHHEQLEEPPLLRRIFGLATPQTATMARRVSCEVTSPQVARYDGRTVPQNHSEL